MGDKASLCFHGEPEAGQNKDPLPIDLCPLQKQRLQCQSQRESLNRSEVSSSGWDTRLQLERLCQHLSTCCKEWRRQALRALHVLEHQANSVIWQGM